ncbi:MAG TPA: hypothetical protein VFS77_03625 [Pyrinomonadaceae bacterium]|nr:hypothetical protein [Pyrinomonadaceae bacterium]
MKEITRRLYTKPVMLTLATLVGLGLMVGLFITANSRAAMSTFIPAGDDKFETTNNGETYHNFQASPIAAGFFNFDGKGTSSPYSGLVPLEGRPLANQEAAVDTVIHRNNDVWVPGSTTIKITALSLVSINPITVTYSDRPAESWSVAVGLSDLQASTGTMSIGSGGTFDSSLNVFPKFTFTRLSDGAQKVLDTGGSSGLSALTASQATAIGDDVVIGPGPEPQPTIAPCKATIDDVEGTAKLSGASSAAAATGCAPVTLTSTNSPWQICADGRFCIPRPITEQEILASHHASPPGTKKIGVR